MRTMLLAGWATATIAALGAAIAAPDAPLRHGPAALGAAPDTRTQALAQARATFARLDRDKDGVVTRTELPARPMVRGGPMAFDARDTDHDGRISPAEVAAGRASRGHVPAPDDVLRVAPPGGQPESPPASPPDGKFGGGALARLFDMADADHDGRVTRAEADAAALARFDRADADRDGRLDDAEKMAWRPQMRTRLVY